MALCLICLLKPSLYFSCLGYCPMTFNCYHSSNPGKPSIRDSKIKRYGGYLLQSLAAILGTTELYYRFRSNNFGDVQTIFSFSEFVIANLIIGWIISLNFCWKEKLAELKVMLYIFEYLLKFGDYDEVTRFYKDRYFFCFVGIVVSMLSCGSRFFSYVSNENGSMATLYYLISFLVGYLVSSFYIRILIDTTIYLGFFKKISNQIDRELKVRLQNTGNISLVHKNNHHEADFLRKMIKLRRLYLAILTSFRRSRLLLRSFMEFSTVGSYLLLIWLLFVSIMSVSGIVIIGLKQKLIFMRFIVQIGFVYLWGYTCDQIENMVIEMKTLFFRVPTTKMNKDEMRELEVFMKLLSWEDPMKGPRTNILFGVSCFSGLTVDVVVNAMVLIQLYFWFGR